MIVENKSGFVQKVLDGLQVFMAFSSSLFICIVLIRLTEYFLLNSSHKIPVGGIFLIISGLRFDVFVFLQISSLLLIPFLVFYFIHRNLANGFYYVVASIITLIYLGLINYFNTTSLPLGADLYSYSIADIKQTLNAAGSVNIAGIALLFAGPVLFIILSRFAFLVQFPLYILIPFVLISAGIWYVPSLAKPGIGEKLSETNYNLKISKLSFFLADSYRVLTKDDNIASENYYLEEEIENQYLSNEFSFLRKRPSGDVLGSFFDSSAVKPSFVFIIVEGLGRAFSGPDAYLGSFTPFVDSLSKQSLYWKNCLSSTGRTFGVLPTIFGSLPFGVNGFMDMNPMPKTESLISLLQREGYKSSFYYGSDSHFELMDDFLKKQGKFEIIDKSKFGPSYKLQPPGKSGFSWGYGDKDLFKRSFEKSTNNLSNSPELRIYLTVSMHSPFVIHEQKKYNQLAKTQIMASGVKREENLPYLSQYASIRYTDDALKYFFKEYSKREDYKSTIFIITGDHRMPEIPIASKTDRYHVPLLIYSPLLKTNRTFSSVITHFDLLPGIANFMNVNYGMPLPNSVAWLGMLPDTNQLFRSNCSIPFMPNKNEQSEYLEKNYFISSDKLYIINENLYAEPIEDPVKFNELKGLLDAFKVRNQQMINTTRLLPDSLLSK